MRPPVSSKTITKIVDESQSEVSDLLAVEEPLEIRLGFGAMGAREQKSLSVTMRTPGYDFELVMGFLFTESIVQQVSEIESIKHCEDLGKQSEKGNVVRVELKPGVVVDFERLQRHFYTSSSCGVCGKTSIAAVEANGKRIETNTTVPAHVLHQLPQKLNLEQRVFQHTGGLHASALFDKDGALTILREDIGRHNALDKVIGAQLMKNQLPLSNSILLVSGRTSFELIQKAAMAGIPIVAAIGAPSSLAVELASEVGMTLIGFLKHDSMNVYSRANRVTG